MRGFTASTSPAPRKWPATGRWPFRPPLYRPPARSRSWAFHGPAIGHPTRPRPEIGRPARMRGVRPPHPTFAQNLTNKKRGTVCPPPKSCLTFAGYGLAMIPATIEVTPQTKKTPSPNPCQKVMGSSFRPGHRLQGRLKTRSFHSASHALECEQWRA